LYRVAGDFRKFTFRTLAKCPGVGVSRMVLALSMSGSAILLPVSTIGDEDGAAIASPIALGWAARDVFAAEPSEKAAGARILADRFAALARRTMEKHIKSSEIKMTESEA
jgi:hypothetical protein